MSFPGLNRLLILFFGVSFLVLCTTGRARAVSTRLAASPSSLSFGTVQVGSSKTQPATLTNSSTSNITISQITTTGAGFSLSGLTLPMTLGAGQSYTFSAVFTPSAAITASGNLSVVSLPPNASLAIPASGTGTTAGQMTVSPATLNFGSAMVGTSTAMSAILSATGSSITITSATSNSSEFTVSGLSLPLTLASGQSTSFSVRFTPQTSGTASASLAFISNAANSTVTETLTGTGTTALQHKVTLSWTGSSSGITGYNVYRASTPGGPYTKINSVLNASSGYTDGSVNAGQTYYYVTTAVAATGKESGYSNQVQAVVPSP